MGDQAPAGCGVSFDLAGLRGLVATHGPVVRVVVAGVEGSGPREAGASMVVWGSGQAGTIGGGALEFAAANDARARLAAGRRLHLERVALGPGLGQCCGGAVRLLSEVWDDAALDAIQGPLVARSVNGRAMPLAVRRMVAAARGTGAMPPPGLVDGWMVEPLAAPSRLVWVWGAGHVGRALVAVLCPLPGVALTWADVAATRFPAVPPGVTQICAANPADLVPYAPVLAEHFILTYSHALDLELCHRLLGHGFGSVGLIGSGTKSARFAGRLKALGHSAASIARITCPIGDPALGKHPQAIAVGVAAGFLAANAVQTIKERAG